jgi:two-component system cell cycle sensor histidine kinase/response regulator CckA
MPQREQQPPPAAGATTEASVRGAAHDLNELLGVILGRAERLRGHDADPETARHLAAIETAARDAAAIVCRILDGGSPTASRRPVGLRGLVADILELSRRHWEGMATGSRSSTVLNEVPADLGAMVAPTAVREVLLNLVVNALQAMPEGGCVRLGAHVTGEGVLLEVADDGPGLDAVTAARIFEPEFSRGKPGGRGLGLTVCRELARAWGGNITVASEPGRGTTFAVLLPGAPCAWTAGTEQRGGGRLESAPRGPSRRVLVVDDAAEMRELLAEILAADGHAVDLANDGEMALTSHHPGEHDLILLDLSLPGISGLEVARTLRERDPEVALVLVSGWGGEALGEAARELVDLTVAKPLDVARVRELVDRGGAAVDRRRRDAGAVTS